MELRSLHYFVRIAELGSITRASAHLQIAQPALTRHIQRLEDEVDAALFTRANRGVRLTEAGQKLLDSAQRILRDVERAGDEIRAHKAHPSGKIILGVSPTLCPVVVPELFARMRGDYPLIELKVVHAGTVRLEEFIVAGLVDLALMAEISRSRLIASTRLAEEEMVLVTRPGARPSGVVSAEELNRTPLILGDGLRAALEVLLAGRGIALQVDTELNDHETIRLMVQQGVGASILPHSSVCRECARGVAQAHRITASASSAPWRSASRRAAARPPRARRWPRWSSRCSATSKPTASCVRESTNRRSPSRRRPRQALSSAAALVVFVPLPRCRGSRAASRSVARRGAQRVGMIGSG